MPTADTRQLFPLSSALEVAGVKPGKFHRHFYGGILGKTLQQGGEFSAQITDPQRGAGAGRGGGRFVTMEGAICLAIFFRLLTGGVPSDRALRIAQTFVFLGETGNGLRAFNAGTARPAGGVFPGSQITFLVTVAGNLQDDAWDGIVFIPGCDLTAFQIMEWLEDHESATAPLCLVNLSEVVQQMRDGLDGEPAATGQNSGAGVASVAENTATVTDPISAFLAEFAVLDASGRISTLEFQSVFQAWFEEWREAGRPHHGGDAIPSAKALEERVSALGVRKLKSNGRMYFDGIRWSETPAAQSCFAGLMETT